MTQLVKSLPAMQETWFGSWVGKIPWRRERLPTPIFWPGEFHGLYSAWSHKELDTTEQLSHTTKTKLPEDQGLSSFAFVSPLLRTVPGM